MEYDVHYNEGPGQAMHLSAKTWKALEWCSEAPSPAGPLTPTWRRATTHHFRHRTAMIGWYGRHALYVTPRNTLAPIAMTSRPADRYNIAAIRRLARATRAPRLGRCVIEGAVRVPLQASSTGDRSCHCARITTNLRPTVPSGALRSMCGQNLRMELSSILC